VLTRTHDTYTIPSVTLLPPPLVLLVEDDLDLREAMSELIESQGVRVRAARDGCEGLEILRSGLRPRAVFLDQCMPRLDGASVLAAMVEDPALAEIPVVWMSGEHRKPPPSVAVCLQKPFEVSDLAAILTSLCSPA
jgi:CheY-like chemotaxis protein